MASISGPFSSYPSLLRLRIECYQISTNIAANTSVIRADAYIDFSGGSATSYNNTVNITINGQTGSWNIGTQSYSGSGPRLVVGGYDITIPHNADGSASIGFSGSASTGGWGSASASGTLSSPSEITDFDFSAGAPSSVTATFTAGVGINVTWGASTSYKTPVTYYISYASSSNGGSTFGSWSSEVTTTNLSYLYSSLTAGLTYKFRVRAYNGYDSYSGYTETAAPVFLASGGKRYTTSNTWVQNTTDKRWNGSAWVNKTINRRYNGTAWVDEA